LNHAKERLGVDSNPNLGHEEYSSGGDSATAQALYRACDAGGRAQQGRDHQDKGRWQEGVARQVSAKKKKPPEPHSFSGWQGLPVAFLLERARRESGVSPRRTFAGSYCICSDRVGRSSNPSLAPFLRLGLAEIGRPIIWSGYDGSEARNSQPKSQRGFDGHFKLQLDSPRIASDAALESAGQPEQPSLGTRLD
jgi:hypothetical protein